MSHPIPVVVERGKPLSQSFVWNLQSQFYDSLGIDAWLRGAIPSTITTNSFIARAYARMIAAYLADVEADEALIVELGAGHGRFSYLCIRHLLELANAGLLPARKWQYVMTDLAERNLAFWQGHEAFEPLVDRGVVDFARFQAGVDESLQLRRGRTTIDRKHPVRHLIVIGNYFFDSLPIDVWQVEDGTLRECRPVMKLAPTATCRDTSDFSILDQLQVNWESRSVPRAGYACSELNHLVEHFRASLRESTFSIPVGGIETLRTIDSWSEHGSLTLIADKGYARECDLEGRTPPTMVRHGCFSFSVNFCALAEWFRERGGAAWLPSRRDGALEVGAFVTDRASWDVDRLHREYAAGVNQFSPGDYHRLTRRDVRDPSSLSLAHCLALLQLGADDPCLLYILRRTLRRQIESASISERQTLTEILIRAADLYYHLDDRDFPFAIGALHQRLGNAGPAAALFRESLRLFGDDPVTRRNLASCQASLAATVWPLPASSELPSTISP